MEFNLHHPWDLIYLYTYIYNRFFEPNVGKYTIGLDGICAKTTQEEK